MLHVVDDVIYGLKVTVLCILLLFGKQRIKVALC